MRIGSEILRRLDSGWRALLLAAVGYTTLLLWWTYPLVWSPATSMPELAHGRSWIADIVHYDRLLSIAGTARNARAIARLDLEALVDTGLCYPHPNAGLLGEHMIEVGLLSVPALVFTDEPVALHNWTALASALIAGLGCMALVRRWTGSTWAGFVAGLALIVHPARLTNFAHPAVSGVHWIPVVLLCIERMLASGRLRDGFVLAIVSSVAGLTGSYPLLMLVLLGAPYTAIRLVAVRRALEWRHLAFLAVATLLSAAVVGSLLYAYAEHDSQWSIFKSRTYLFLQYPHLVRGSWNSVGVAVAALALVGLWTIRTGPVLALVGGTVACLSFAARGPLWQGGFSMPSLYDALFALSPMVGAVRAPVAVALGAFVGIALLAGIGHARLTARLRPAFHLLVTVSVVAGILAEMLVPSLAEHRYGLTLKTKLHTLTVNEEVRDSLHVFEELGPDDALIHIPFPPSIGRGIARQAPYVMFSSYSGRPATAACYNSFLPPDHFEVVRMVAAPPTDRTVDELVASGLRNVIVHKYWARRGDEAKLAGLAGVRAVYRGRELTAYRLDRKVQVHSDAAKLEVAGTTVPKVLQAPSTAPEKLAGLIRVELVNRAGSVWAAPKPLHPVEVQLEWRTLEGTLAKRSSSAMVLPLALASGASTPVVFDARPYPSAGSYLITLTIPSLDYRFESETSATVR